MHIESYTERLSRLKQFRREIRWHRDQKGDDRCWVDDFRVWQLLEDSPPRLVHLPSYDAMMARCEAFYVHRRADTPDPVPTTANTNQTPWDDDLEQMCASAVYDELVRLQDAVRLHRDTASRRPLTINDDRALYAVLPECIPADFRLPSHAAFLGDAVPNAGCPAFWWSHQACPGNQHDLHRWGPCSMPTQTL